MDYGGFGANVLYYPQENIGVFGGVGYNFAGIGFNAGFKARIISNKKLNPYLIAMYGYNAVIYIVDVDEYNKFSTVRHLE